MFFSETHEWVKIEGTIATIGISQFAQKELGEIVFIELPKIGTYVQPSAEMAVLESTKAATDLYAPISGTVLEVNQSLLQNLNLLNLDPENQGWIVKITVDEPKDLENLLTPTQYQQLIYQ